MVAHTFGSSILVVIFDVVECEISLYVTHRVALCHGSTSLWTFNEVTESLWFFLLVQVLLKSILWHYFIRGELPGYFCEIFENCEK